MALQLVVAQPFASYSIGDQITDDATVAEILAGTNALRCRRVNPPDPNAPDPLTPPLPSPRG